MTIYEFLRTRIDYLAKELKVYEEKRSILRVYVDEHRAMEANVAACQGRLNELQDLFAKLEPERVAAPAEAPAELVAVEAEPEAAN